MAAIFGVDRILHLELVPGSSPVSFLDQSLKGLENRLREFKSDVLPAFGKPIGLAVNYSEVSSVTFDLQGNPLRVFDHIIEPGNVFLSMGGRAISDDPALGTARSELTILLRSSTLAVDGLE